MADKEQKQYYWISKTSLKKLIRMIADKINQLTFKISDAVTFVSGESTDEEIPTAKAVNDVVADVRGQAAINKSSIGLQKKNLFKSYAKSETIGGITFIVDDNGFISADGINSGSCTYDIYNSNKGHQLMEFNKDVIITYIGNIIGMTSGVRLIYPGDSSYHYIVFTKQGLVIPAHTKITQVYFQQFTPNTQINISDLAVMIRYADIEDDTYEPYVDDLQTQINNVIGETQIITLTNSQEYPFNNSQQSVSLTTARTSTDYEVDTEIISPTNGEQVGRIIITDKLTNGFKIGFTGSASKVQIKCTVKGGMS